MESALERIFERVVNALSMRSGISNLRAQKKEVIDSLIDGLKIEGLNTNGHRTKNPQDVPWNFYGQSTITNPCARGTGLNDLGSPTVSEHCQSVTNTGISNTEERENTPAVAVVNEFVTDLRTPVSESMTPIFLPEPRCDIKKNLFFDAECLVIGSYSEMTAGSTAVHKLESSYGGKEEEVLAIAEHVCGDRYKEMASLAPFPVRGSGKPVGVWVDDEKVLHSKEFYLTLMEDFLKQCKTPAAVIWYSGHGEDATGNWCFRDGTIRFREIFELYQAHFKHKLLYIISDCSYSGCWVQDMACMLDDMGIPPCGHHTREQGILLKLWTSCHCSEQETFMRFVEEGVKIVNDGCLTRESYTVDDFRNHLTLHTIHQTCPSEDANTCSLGLGMKSFFAKWKHLAKSLASFVFLVRGEDKGKAAWHYAVVEQQKVNIFRDKVASGTIDIAKYGEVFASGWGENPPEEVRSAVRTFFGLQ